MSSNRLATSRRKVIGARVSLVPTDNLKVVHLGGEPVIPRSEVIPQIREHPGLYGNAEDLLSDRR